MLIGFYSSAGLGEGRDYFTSPYKLLYGIEIHANALYTIFENKFLYQINPAANIIIFVLLLLLFAVLLPRIKIWKGFILFLVTYIVIFFGGMIVFNHFSIIIDMISMMMFSLFLFLSITVYRVLTEEKEKRQIKGMFAQYVNPEVVTELMLDPEKLQLGGEDRDLTVLFSDIRGFTTISENLSPQQLVHVLNSYLSDMTDLLFEYRGTLDKYMGDAVMAFWGAPVPIKNHAILAADSSLRMMEKLHELNEKMLNDPEYKVFKEKNIKLDIGIGLNSGIMTVGNMGSAVRKNYTIMGDAVNLGSRLEGVNKVYGTNIIVSEFTYEHIKDHFICRELDYIRVKGKYLPVKIYELMGKKDEVTSDIIKKMD
jgi:adenylate cyclase